jgi:hypothetical protein
MYNINEVIQNKLCSKLSRIKYVTLWNGHCVFSTCIHKDFMLFYENSNV